jgi:hypothetical protein
MDLRRTLTDPLHFLVLLAEKAAFKEMLHFLYAGSLSQYLSEPTASVRELVDLLVWGTSSRCPLSWAPSSRLSTEQI